MKRKVGLIGYGTIGKYIFEKLSRDGVEFAFIFNRSAAGDKQVDSLITDSVEEMRQQCAAGVDLVIEAATAQAVLDLAPAVLPFTDMAVFSATAFADQDFLNRMQHLCQTHRRRLYIPHGAIVGLDGIVDGKEVLQAVTVTTTKRPANLGRTDTGRTILYEGPTREVCKLYPRNVNVHAAIALAGLGFDETRSIIISDPGAPGNTHCIEVKAQGCTFKIDVVSEPGSGVTGAYTPVSAYSSIRRILSRQGLVIL